MLRPFVSPQLPSFNVGAGLQYQIEKKTFPGAEVASDAELDAFVRNTAEIVHHPVGTCTMGNGPMAVVDPELRLRGLSGLRVAATPTHPPS